MQQVDRLAVELPAQPQVKRQVILHAPVVSDVARNIKFLELKLWRAVRQSQLQGGISKEARETADIPGIGWQAGELSGATTGCRSTGAGKGVRPVNVRQECVRRALLIELTAPLNRMAPHSQ